MKYHLSDLLPPPLIDGEALTFPAHVTPDGKTVHAEAIYLKGHGWCVNTVHVAHERQDTAEVSFKPMLLVNQYAPDSRFAAGMGLLMHCLAKRDDGPSGTFPVPAR